MGLALEIGLLADLKESDPQGFASYQKQFEQLNQLLQLRELPLHHEPTTLDDKQKWGCDLWGYSGLHTLRRVAALIALTNQLPTPLVREERASQDLMVEKYYSLFQRSPKNIWSRFLGKSQNFGRQFQHLMIHSDSEGFYLPIDFDDVIQDSAAFGGAVGSSVKLLKECKILASKLNLPLHIDSESKELWAAAQNPGVGPELWQIYGIESFICSNLLRACEISIEVKAAIVFT